MTTIRTHEAFERLNAIKARIGDVTIKEALRNYETGLREGWSCGFQTHETPDLPQRAVLETAPTLPEAILAAVDSFWKEEPF